MNVFFQIYTVWERESGAFLLIPAQHHSFSSCSRLGILKLFLFLPYCKVTEGLDGSFALYCLILHIQRLLLIAKLCQCDKPRWGTGELINLSHHVCWFPPHSHTKPSYYFLCNRDILNTTREWIKRPGVRVLTHTYLYTHTHIHLPGHFL